jgi:hypothetical protein
MTQDLLTCFTRISIEENKIVYWSLVRYWQSLSKVSSFKIEFYLKIIKN